MSKTPENKDSKIDKHKDRYICSILTYMYIFECGEDLQQDRVVTTVEQARNKYRTPR